MTDLETILSWFQTGDFPTEEEFRQTFSSFRLNNKKIPIADIDALESSLNNKINANEYVKDGKIRADKIEALGLTELIEASEKDISEFAENSDKYEFQQNDFIAIPNADGNFSLYLFKGGEKKIIGNYLPTGLTNITIEMVDGLQDALNKKLDKPAVNGDYFINLSGNPSYKTINPEENYLLFWDGSNFKNSSIFRETGGLKFGIGTNAPSEQLHLTNRARMKALVLEENSEALPQQMTYSKKKFFGADSAGTKRQIQFADYEAMYETFNNMTSEQNLLISQLLNGGAGSGGSMSVNLISPPIVQNQYDSMEYVMLRGANLNLAAISRKIEILNSDKTTVLAVVPDNQIQTYENGLSLVFYYNFFNFPEGQKFLRLTSGAKVYITTLDLKIVKSIKDVDIDALSWEILYASDVIPDINDIAQGRNAFVKVPYISPASPSTKIALKSEQIFDQGDDFYLEFTVNVSKKDGGPDANLSYIGLGYSNVANSLVNNSLVYFGYNYFYNAGIGIYNNQINIDEGIIVPLNKTVVMIKTGNLFRTIIDGINVATTLSNGSGYSIFFSIIGRPITLRETVGITINKAFKIN